MTEQINGIAPVAPLDGIKVIMNPHMPPGTMVVSPDVFEQIGELFPARGQA